MILRAVIWHPSYSGVQTSASVAYLSGLCFPKERDATKNAGTLGFSTQNRGVIYRADGVSVGVKAAGGRDVDLGNQTRRISSARCEVTNWFDAVLAEQKIS
jgi:hypothetical protein